MLLVRFEQIAFILKPATLPTELLSQHIINSISEIYMYATSFNHGYYVTNGLESLIVTILQSRSLFILHLYS